MRLFLPLALFCLVATAAQAGQGVYNQAGIEIGVVERQNADGSFLVMPLPSSGLGNMPILIAPSSVVRRADGGLMVLASAPLPATP